MGSMQLRQTTFHGPAGGFGGPVRLEHAGGVLWRVLDLLFVWQDRAHQRMKLAEMTDRDLRDMGLSRIDAFRESRKPFWRA